MIASNPITINSNTYNHLSVNLAITGTYKSDGTPEVSFALQLIPVRIGNGVVELCRDASISLLRGQLSEVTDPAEQAAVTAIQTALQNLITAKGL
jgi:hypothetical protein